MDRGLRRYLSLKKYKQRKKKWNLDLNDNSFYFLKTTSRPCNCSHCKNKRYSKKERSYDIDLDI